MMVNVTPALKLNIVINAGVVGLYQIENNHMTTTEEREGWEEGLSKSVSQFINLKDYPFYTPLVSFICSTILKAREEEKERMKKWILEKRYSNESFNKMSTGNDIWEATGFNIALSDMLSFLYDRK